MCNFGKHDDVIIWGGRCTCVPDHVGGVYNDTKICL